MKIQNPTIPPPSFSRLRAASSIGRFLPEKENDRKGGRQYGSVVHTRGRRRVVQRWQYLRAEAGLEYIREFGDLVQIQAGDVEKQAEALDRGLVPSQQLRQQRWILVRGAKESVEGERRRGGARESRMAEPEGGATVQVPRIGEPGSPEQLQFRLPFRQLRDVQREPQLPSVPSLVHLRRDGRVLDNEGGISQALLQKGHVHERGEDLQPGRGEDAAVEQQATKDQAGPEASQLRPVLREQHRVHETLHQTVRVPVRGLVVLRPGDGGGREAGGLRALL